MNEQTYTIYIIATIYSSIMIGVSLVILGITIPKVIAESNVRNGLIGFRRLLLLSIVSIFFLGLVAEIIILARWIFSLESVRYISFFLLMIFATIMPIIAIAKYKTFTYQFSPSSKKMHDRQAILELKEDARDARRETARIKLNKDRRDATVERSRKKIAN